MLTFNPDESEFVLSFVRLCSVVPSGWGCEVFGNALLTLFLIQVRGLNCAFAFC
jgi:hypothetical protein